MFSPAQFVAHRGYASKYPENTLTAITAALNAGAVNVEIDIQFSSDGIPILYHDTHLKRISGLDDSIFDFKASELIEFKAYHPDKFGDQFINVPISTAEEFAQLVGVKSHAHYFVELKRESIKKHSLEHCLTSLTDCFKNCMQNITLISDHFESVLKAKKEYGFNKTGIVFRDWEQRNNLIRETQADIAYINYKKIPEDEPITADCPIALYEIANPELAKELLERGAAKIESFAIGELIEALCPSTTTS